MELKLTEIYNNSLNEYTYEDTPKKIIEFTPVVLPNSNSQAVPNKFLKPKISYDDILNSLNMKVNNGKLEFIISKPSPTQSPSTNINLPQNLKQRNNYIYNKYFSDYKETKEEIPERPLTRSEYIQKMKDIQRERQRVYQIKPNKLFFPPIHTNYADLYENNINDLRTNKLFSLR